MTPLHDYMTFIVQYQGNLLVPINHHDFLLVGRHLFVCLHDSSTHYWASARAITYVSAQSTLIDNVVIQLITVFSWFYRAFYSTHHP